MLQELINLIDEISKIGDQTAHTFTLTLAHNDMDAEMWARLQDALKEINLKSQEGFLLVANLRRSTPA
jgi:hypothetical protein